MTLASTVPTPFSSYVQAPNEDKQCNTHAPGTLDAICLRSNCTLRGGHESLHLPTGKSITRHRKITVIPITKDIINKVNHLGTKDDIKSLKIQSSCFADWTAEVDDAQDADG